MKFQIAALILWFCPLIDAASMGFDSRDNRAGEMTRYADAVETGAPGGVRQQKPERTFTFCTDAESSGEISAWNSFVPVPEEIPKLLGVPPPYYTVSKLSMYKASVLVPPAHGEVRLLHEPSQHWTLVPNEGYSGQDKAVFLVEGKGRQFQVVVNFWVVEIMPNDHDELFCTAKKF